MLHAAASGNWRAGGMSSGLPRGAPLSAHLAIFAISSSLNDGSFLNFWMPIVFSMNQGGISRREVLSLMLFAHGRASS